MTIERLGLNEYQRNECRIELDCRIMKCTLLNYIDEIIDETPVQNNYSLFTIEHSRMISYCFKSYESDKCLSNKGRPCYADEER